MRDLLFLSHRIPYPPDKGDKIRSFHILQHLSSRFRVHLGCFSDDIPDAKSIEKLRELCADVFCLPMGTTKKYLRAPGALMRGLAISEACYQDSQMAAWVRKKLVGGRIRDVFLFCSSIWPYVSDAPRDVRVIVDMVDIDSEKWGAFAKSAPWPMRAIYRREQRKLFALEKRAARGSSSCLFVSRAEAEAFVRLAPEFARSASHMENGVNLDIFDCTRAYNKPFASGSAAIVFTGMMNYQPNIEAVAWFAHEAMPEILRRHQNAQFWIVGAQPTRAVRRLAGAVGVHVTGRVDDVRPYLSNATCVVAPLRIARGIQNKVLEAMAMAKPVVLTPAALVGVNAVSERDVLLARTTSDFVEIVSDVIEGRWPGLGAAARARIQMDYQWPKNLHMLDALFAPEGMHATSLPAQRSEPLLGEAAT